MKQNKKSLLKFQLIIRIIWETLEKYKFKSFQLALKRERSRDVKFCSIPALDDTDHMPV